ncbi:cellulose binding domain-containing protein [Herbidospora mongoliensis]|uniref:cellulose binding domain-containing protein n=1 Tax=Herbidospora mongoliensis TaxID=688067 RepID=UPI0009FC8711|nr:cellulose binding domain-containing protein [Herbidospora mongoliensis]
MRLKLALIAGVLLAIGTTPPAHAADTTPPTRPSGVTSCPPPGMQGGLVGICWQPSSDYGGSVAGYDVYQLTATGFVKAASPTSSPTVITGLVRGRAYSFYLVARDLSGNVSGPSPFITLVATTGLAPTPTPTPTLSGDTEPPSRPQNLRDQCVFDFPGTAFCWDRSTDNVAVTGYDVYREAAAGGWIKVGSTGALNTFFVETGMVTGQSYTYTVVAKDAAGNVSAPATPASILARPGLPTPTPTPTPTPSPTPTAGDCEVSYNDVAWNTGMSAWLSIKNTGTSPIAGWRLEFDFPDAGQRYTTGHSATFSQSGAHLTAVNLPWNAQIGAGSTVSLGFNGTHTGQNPKPTAFTVNGLRCTIKA